MEEYLQPAKDVELEIENEHKRAILESLRCVRGFDVPSPPVAFRIQLRPFLARDVAGSRLRSDNQR